jgi:GxxExxY protein
VFIAGMPHETRAPRDKRDPLSYLIIGCAIRVHKDLGPGLLESSYMDPMQRELEAAGLGIVRQPRMNLIYRDAPVAYTYRPDYVINNEIVLELKSVSHFVPAHTAQVLTYMRISEIERGLLINFNVEYLIRGVKRLILTRSRLDNKE